MKRFFLLATMVLVGIAAEAQLVRSSALTVIREELPPVELGWKHIVDGQIGVDIFDAEPIVGVHYIAAYRFTDNYLAGVGVGIEGVDEGFVEIIEHEDISVAVPIYLHGRYYFATHRWSPYVGISAGIYFASKQAYLNNYWEGYEVEGSNPPFTSAFADLNVGLNHRLGADAKNELSIYAGLKFIRQRCVHVWSIPSYDYTYPDGVEIGVEGFEPVVGLYFGTSITF